MNSFSRVNINPTDLDLFDQPQHDDLLKPDPVTA